MNDEPTNTTPTTTTQPDLDAAYLAFVDDQLFRIAAKVTDETTFADLPELILQDESEQAQQQ